MIKANELRIGNWVKHNSNYSYRNENLKEFEFQINISDFYADAECTLSIENDLQPIPLTEQWLIDFGFVGRKDFMWNRKVGVQIRDGKFYLALQDKSGALFNTVVEVKFVHKLQNFYFDVENEELELKQTVQ